MISAVQFSIYN